MPKALPLSAAMKDRRQFDIFDDFLWYISPHLWTSLAADSTATVACGTTTNTAGLLTLTTDTTDNNECAVATTTACFLAAAEKPLLFETGLNYTERATNKANVCVGFSSVMNTANMMVDNGAGPATTFGGAIIYKVDGGTVWNFMVSTGTTQQTVASASTAGGGSQVLRIEVTGRVVTALKAVPFLNGQQMLDTNNRPISLIWDATSVACSQAGVYLKNGGTGGEIAVVDYIGASGLR